MPYVSPKSHKQMSDLHLAQRPAVPITPAQALHKDALVWDNHICLPMDLTDNLAALPDLYRYRRVGTDVVSINAGYGTYPLANHLALLEQMRGWLLQRPDDFVIVDQSSDIARAKAKGALAVVFDVEGAGVLVDDISIIAKFAKLGVRWMLMAYNRNNLFAGGCHDADSGLSTLGKSLIDEMFRVGITPCCSHTGYETAAAVIDYASGPILFSHSNPRALHDHPRNIPNELIDACTAKGGVIGINGVNVFLGPDPVATPKRVAEHVDYIIQRAGPGCVSLALDSTVGYQIDMEIVTTSPLFPKGYGYEHLKIMEPELMPHITEALLAMGHSDDIVRQVLGLNLLRIAEQNWKPQSGG
jgi:membrane dipeptidase